MNIALLFLLYVFCFHPLHQEYQNFKEFGEIKANDSCQYCLEQCIEASHTGRDEKTSVGREACSTVGVF